MLRFLLLFTLLFNFSCQKKPYDTQDIESLVVVSIAPYAGIVKQITGDTLQVKVLIPSGANAHFFEPSPASISEIARAAVYFKLGEPVEEKIINSLQQKNPHLLVYDLKTGITLIDDPNLDSHHEEGKDIHIWLSPKLMIKQASAMGRILIDRFPEHANMFRENLQNLIALLEGLDTEIMKRVSSLNTKVLLVSHPAFGYFCEEYSCRQIPIEYEGKEPSPKQLNEVISQAETSGVKGIIVLPQFSMKAANYIAKELRIPTYEFDPFLQNYFVNMKYLTNLVILSNENGN